MWFDSYSSWDSSLTFALFCGSPAYLGDRHRTKRTETTNSAVRPYIAVDVMGGKTAIADLTGVAVATRESCGTALSGANHEGIARIPRIVGVGASAIPCDSTRICECKDSRLSIEKKQEVRRLFGRGGIPPTEAIGEGPKERWCHAHFHPYTPFRQLRQLARWVEFPERNACLGRSAAPFGGAGVREWRPPVRAGAGETRANLSPSKSIARLV